MKIKMIKVAVLISLFALISTDTFAGGWFHKWRGNKQHRVVEYQKPPESNPPVGAPLDGGILAILGAAGVAYYSFRRNKKNAIEEE